MLKDSKSLEISCYVLGAGAFGVFFRWMQLQLGYNDGLPGKSVWHFFIILLILAAAGVFLRFVRKTADSGLRLSGDFFEALRNDNKGYTVFRWGIGVMMILGSALLFMSSEVDMNAAFLRVLAVLGVLTGLSFPLLLTCANKPHVTKNSTITLLSLIPLLLFSVWILTSYKQNSINPIAWDYAVEILTLIVDALAFFRIAGFAYGVPDTKKSMFYCMWGAMLSILSLADSRYLGQQIMLVSAALMLTMYNWIMIANLKAGETGSTEENEEEEDPEEVIERRKTERAR